MGKLQVINRGTETAYDLKMTVPEGAALDLHRADTIAKIPGNGRSVTIDVLNNNRFLGASADDVFDIHIAAGTEDGDEHNQDVFLDLNG